MIYFRLIYGIVVLELKKFYSHCDEAELAS